MAKYADTERSRSVTPVADIVRGPNQQSAARRALLLERLRATPVRDLDSPPPRLHALPVQATPGGSLNVRGDSVPLEQNPGGRLRIGEATQARQPSLDLSLCSDVVERVEALDMSEDEAAELLQSDPWHVKRWMRDLPGASELPRASETPGASDTPTSNTVFLAPLAPSARSEVTVAAEVDVRPSTSTVTALSQTVPRRDGSELDSDFDDEFDVPVMPVVGRDLPDTEELDEPLQDLVNEIDTGMDDAADSLLGTSAIFAWSPDFDSFRGVRGEFSGPTPGPIKNYETPYDAFTDIWDEDIIRLIATEINRYAHQTIETMRNAGTLKPSSRLHSWTDTNADEIMVFFAMLMYMAIDPRTSITEYWTSDEVLQLQGFKSLMSFNRYTLLNKCIHFVDNVAVQSQQLSQSGVSSSAGVSRRLGKLAPIIEHLGKKFKALYNLGPDISIDESLTLFKGRLSWAQTIRSKAARFGIKSYELCESRTGYMARFQIYTGKDDSSDGDLSLGVDLGEKSTKVVLELLQGLEHRGHCVVMDNYYNCPSLARYLKSLGFDCLGTLRVNRRNVPSDFKVSKKVKKGTIISRHSGDVSIIALMDSKMVNIISTYHRPDTYNETRAGKPTEKPVCIKDYNKSMGGVDLKDQKLSMYLLERKRGVKWYVKMFKRLLNELSKLDIQVLGSSAPPTSSALSCSIDLPTDVIPEAVLSPEKAGSLLSVQSAPTEQRERPASLLLELPLATQVGAYLSAMSPTEQEEDSLLTLSSVTARPLLAASRKLRPALDSSAESTAPPDGGYGWVVVFGAFMVQFWVAGLFKSYGVLYVEIMETFPDSSESVASWIPAALSTLCLALAPLSSALCEKYSCRLVVFIGGLFCATGLALSFFSKGLLHLLLSFGVMTGIGGGLSTTPGIVIVSQYFDKHRALANGICVSGTAAGSFVFPMLIEKLVDMYGLHGTVLLLGGGMLHVCVSATLYRAAPASFNTSALADRTPASTSTEHTTLLHDVREDQGIMFKSDSSKDNRLQSLFQPENELTLNQKNLLLNEDAKRSSLITEIMHPSLIEVARQQMQTQHSDSEDSEGLDVLGVVGLPKEVVRLRLRPTRSSSILHSVEDLSTDSTCVYKARRNLSSKSLYIRPPPSRLIPSKLAEPIVIKQEEVQKEDVQIEKKSSGCVEVISRYLDVSLLRSWRFGLLCASVALMSCGSPYALYYLPAYTVAAGHSKSAAGHLVAISAVLDLCGRLGLGWLCDLHLFCRRKAYIVSILVAGIAVLTLPSLKSWWALAIASGAYGLCLGCWFLLVPVLLADAFGTARIASSYGLVRMFQSLAAVSVPPTAGLLRDVTGGYSWCFYGMGSCMVLGSIPVIAFHLSTKNEDDSSVD